MDGWIRLLLFFGLTFMCRYFFLVSHISFSIIVVPFVLFAFYYSLSNQIIKHKKLVKFTFPIWLYVSISGVIVYYMISEFYQQL